MNARSEQRLTSLYHATSRRVYAYLRRHTDQETAEAVLADVFIKAWRHVDELTGDPMGWLIVTAQRTLVDHHRARQRRSRLDDAFFAEQRHATPATPEATVVERQMVLRALQQLGEVEREALLLTGWDGLGNQAAARVQGCSEAAFRKRLSRARSRLRELLEPETASTLTILKGAHHGAL